MKIKKSDLISLINEELKIYYENNESFPVFNNEPVKEKLETSRDTDEMLSRLMNSLGEEQVFKQIIKYFDQTNPKMLRQAFDNIAKMYDLRLEEQPNESYGQGLSYEDAVEEEVTPMEAKQEIEKHGLEWSDFIQDVGQKPMYTGLEVLTWLGY